MSEYKFKAGDKVRYVKGGVIGWEFVPYADTDGCVLGDIYSVTEADYDDAPSIKLADRAVGLMLHPGHFELVEEGINDTYRDENGYVYKVTDDATYVTSPSQAKRFNSGKPQLSYLLYWPYAADELARVCQQGAEKYEKFNYKKGAPVSESIDCALRHIKKFLNGEDYDQESGHHHLAHAHWNIARASDEMLGPDKERLDDRYKP